LGSFHNFSRWSYGNFRKGQKYEKNKLYISNIDYCIQYKFILGSIGNLEDGVTSEKTGMFFEKLTDGLASEMIDVNYDPDKFDSERKALLNGTKGHYTHEFTKKFQD